MLSSSSHFPSFACLALAALLPPLAACVIEEAPSHRAGAPRDVTLGGSSGGTGDVGVDASVPGQPVAPMLAVVDTGQVMNAQPGQGVGIFTEYAAGGTWHVWWTCDTARSQLDCDVALSATVAAGQVSALDAAELPAGALTSPSPSRLEVRVVTSTQVHGLTFRTNPGAIVVLEATIGGLKFGSGAPGSFFFFVQDGKINGGFTGPLTNPLQLVGSKP
jgi:hypothetical protein